MPEFRSAIASFCLLGVLALPTTGMAENGAIAYARPASGIVIDGALDDWPQNAALFPINNQLLDDAEAWRDEAAFRVAYDPAGTFLYLAVTVLDESTIDRPEGEADASEEDSLVVYIDAEHSWRASGPWVFLGALEGVSNLSDGEGWDPQTARATDDSAEMAVAVSDAGRTYEWRIRLDQPVRAGKTLGFDLVLVDIDEDVGANPPAFASWGRYASKASRASRLGDLILLGEGQRLGSLSGDMAWAAGVNGPDLGGYRVRIRDRNDPEFWVSVLSDERGEYDVDLPTGTYCVTPAFLLYGSDARYRMRDDVEVCERVRSGESTRAATLVKTLRPVPEHHIRESGLLFSFDEATAKRLDTFMADTMDHYTVPGAAVVIIRDGKIVYRREYGFTNWLTRQAVRPENLFDVGSITKPIFAFAVHRLVEQGVLELDRPLHEYLPFNDITHDERSRQFTARYVLSHQTGLPNWRWQNDDGQLDIEFTPGEGFRYSGEGYDSRGRVIEQLTVEPLETVLLREAVKPLGMSDAVRFSKRDNWHDLFVHGHSELRAFTSRTPDSAHAAYSMMASAGDLAQVMLTWMNRGGGLSDAGYDAMFEAQVDTGTPAQDTPWQAVYGLGPRLLVTPYGRAIGHGGLNWGQVAQMEFFEDHDAAYTLTTNGERGWLLRNALRRFLVAGQEHTAREPVEE